MIMGGSLTAALPLLATAPLLPPIGFIAFVLWRQLKPEVVPAWSAIGFGLFDDLVSGNAMGTALFFWPLFALGSQASGRWFAFRTWRHDWLVVTGATFAYVAVVWLLAQTRGSAPPFGSLLLPLALAAGVVPALLRLATGPGFRLRRHR